MVPVDVNQEPQVDDQIEEIEKTEEVIKRAWRASILGLGLVFPIPILQVYSVILLAGVDRTLPISSKSRRQFRVAWSVNVILVLTICVAISIIMIR